MACAIGMRVDVDAVRVIRAVPLSGDAAKSRRIFWKKKEGWFFNK